MSRIDKMSMEEILKELSLNLTPVNMTFVSRYCPEMIDELQETLKLENEQKKVNDNETLKMVGEAVSSIFIKYENKIDKEKVVLLTVYNCQRMIEEEKIEGDIREVFEKNVRIGLRMLGDKDVTAVVPVNNKDNEKSKDLIIINSQELSRMIKNGIRVDKIRNITKKKKERLDDINKRVAIRSIVKLLKFEDLEYICTSIDVADMLVYQISYNGFTKYIKAHPNKKNRIETGERPEDIQKVFESSFECLVAKTDSIMQNCKYIDIDRMLLLCAFRVIEMLENRLESDIKITDVEDTTGEIGKINDSNQTVNILYSLLKNIYNEIQKDTRNAYVYDYEISYSVEELEHDLRRFIDGKYIKREESEKLKEKILRGEITLAEANQDELELVSVTEKEFVTMIKNSEDNVIYFIEHGFIDKFNITGLLERIEKCSVKLFRIIYENGIINTEQIIELFRTGRIDAEAITIIQDEEILESVNSQVKETIRQLNDKIFKDGQEQTALDMEAFTRYISLYKILSIMGKTEEERLEEAFKFISSFEDSIDSQTLERLYQYGLIPLESAADWGVNLTDMLSNNNIKPTDLKELYAKGIIKLDDIKRVIRKTDMPYEEKMDLIYSTFDGETEEEYNIREELVELLETGESFRGQINPKNIKKPKEPTLRSKEYITDPHARWKLISLIDRDYSKKFLPAGSEVKDGHRVFFLPNQGEVLIERMYQKIGGKQTNAYGNATYIMKSEEFFKHLSEIIVDEAINRTLMVEMAEDGKAIKIRHTKNWGNHIKTYFGITEENGKYTKLELEEIDIAIENIAKSRKERE